MPSLCPTWVRRRLLTLHEYLGPEKRVCEVAATTETDAAAASAAILQRVAALEAVKQTAAAGMPQLRPDDFAGRIAVLEARIDVLNTLDLERRISVLEAEEIHRREESLLGFLSGHANRAESRPEQPLAVQESNRRSTSDVVFALRQLKDEGLAALAKRRFDPFLRPPDMPLEAARQNGVGDDLSDSRMIDALEREEVQTMVAKTRESLADQVSMPASRQCMIQLHPEDLATVTRPIRESMEQNFLALQAEFSEKLRQATGLIGTHMETLINEKFQFEQHRSRFDGGEAAPPELKDDVSSSHHARLINSTASSSTLTSQSSSMTSLPSHLAPAPRVVGQQKLKDPSLANRLMLDLSKVKRQPPEGTVTDPRGSRSSMPSQEQRGSVQERSRSGNARVPSKPRDLLNVSLPPVWEPFAPSPRQFEEPPSGLITRPKGEATMADVAMRNLLAETLATDVSSNTQKWARLDLLWPPEDRPATTGVGAAQNQAGGPVVMTF